MGNELPPLAQRVRDLRSAAGLTQQALAVKAGLSVSLVAQIEQGTNTDPKLSTVLALASALGVAVEQIAAPQLGKPGDGKKGKGK